LWRSVKYEEVYLNDYDCPRAARKGVGSYLTFYNEQRLHQALGYKTPAEVYLNTRSGRRSEAPRVHSHQIEIEHE